MVVAVPFDVTAAIGAVAAAVEAGIEYRRALFEALSPDRQREVAEAMFEAERQVNAFWQGVLTSLMVQPERMN